MKKLTNSVSPFLMLLVPLFLLLGVLAINAKNEIPADKQRASINFQVLSLIGLIHATIH